MKSLPAKEEEPEPTTVDDKTPPLTLPLVQERILQILERVPSLEATAALEPTKVEELEAWCHQVRSSIRQYNLALNFVRLNTYQWPPDRSGHTAQSLSALNSEIAASGSSTSMISAVVNSILTPAVTRLTKKIVKTIEKRPEGDIETEVYHYESVVNDVEMLELNRRHLCEEAIYKRQLLISTMKEMHQCISDFNKSEVGHGERLQLSY